MTTLNSYLSDSKKRRKENNDNNQTGDDSKHQIISLDGSHGEGGGQIVRTALALSALLQVPFRIKNIRQGRKAPGLKQQHLANARQILTSFIEYHPQSIFTENSQFMLNSLPTTE